MYFLRLFFLAWCLSNQLRFSFMVRFYKIHIFDEAFFTLAIAIIATEKVMILKPLLEKKILSLQLCSLSIETIPKIVEPSRYIFRCFFSFIAKDPDPHNGVKIL